MKYVIEILLGLSSGVLIGAIFIALLLLLQLIPKFLQILHIPVYIHSIIFALILGSLLGSYLSFTKTFISSHHLILIIWGCLHGIFNGMLAAALLEVLHVFPLLAKRMHLKRYMRVFLFALLLGKTCGAIIQAVYFYE